MNGSRRIRWVVTAVLVALGTQGCVSVQNYTAASGPRYGGDPDVPRAPAPSGTAASPGAPSPADSASARDLRVASFNIEQGGDIEAALELLCRHPELSDADFLLLQEMDAPGTERIADALGMAWVYYPAALRNGQDFGNAVLSRWPMVEDAKILLPHSSIFGRSRRTATAVTALVDGVPVRVYSVHLATPVNLLRSEREDQLRTVLEDARNFERVVVGGDLNSGSIAEIALTEGFHWPTARGPRTVWFSRVDHVLFRGLAPLWFAGSGTVLDNRGTSDHLPVWARGRLRPGPESAAAPTAATSPAADATPPASDPRATVFLVGDAGAVKGGSPLLDQLHAQVTDAAAGAPTVVAFLGDNVYPAGVRAPGDGFHRDTAVLRSQLDVIRGTGAQALFVPGNHDWDDGGENGLAALERQAAFFRDAAEAGAAVRFLPTDGCPGPAAVDLPGLRLLALDTQWFLHDHPRGCADRTEADVGAALTEALDGAGDREALVLGHHPLRTHGPHGGYFPADRHLFPLLDVASWAWVPLPLLGSVYVAARQSGASDQDLSGNDNEAMRRVLGGAFASATRPPLLYAAGHEHSLQVLHGDARGPALHLVSGAGSKSTPVGRKDDTAWADERPGYMRVDVLDEGIRIQVIPLQDEGAQGAAGAPGMDPAGTGEATPGGGGPEPGVAWCGWIAGGERELRTPCLETGQPVSRRP